MPRRKQTELTERERWQIILEFRSGQKTAKEICDKFYIYASELKRIVHEAGYGY